MPVEQELERATQQVEHAITKKLEERKMTQAELARLMGENRTQVNRAIHGVNDPKSKAIRKKIYRVLDM
ncbi:helix-turn-helix transcriptional regulator [Limosilactobacillus pontis]|uniref:helix-turn-helix domain-containing protein n=1 Tax=Limosilactobacillus pontis TaxID=35787 RepID=UPI002F2650CE